MTDHPEVDLRRVAEAVRAAEETVAAAKADRRRAMEQARAAGLTWRRIAELTGMTDHGVRKALDFRRDHP